PGAVVLVVADDAVPPLVTDLVRERGGADQIEDEPGVLHPADPEVVVDHRVHLAVRVGAEACRVGVPAGLPGGEARLRAGGADARDGVDVHRDPGGRCAGDLAEGARGPGEATDLRGGGSGDRTAAGAGSVARRAGGRYQQGAGVVEGHLEIGGQR